MTCFTLGGDGGRTRTRTVLRVFQVEGDRRICGEVRWLHQIAWNFYHMGTLQWDTISWMKCSFMWTHFTFKNIPHSSFSGAATRHSSRDVSRKKMRNKMETQLGSSGAVMLAVYPFNLLTCGPLSVSETLAAFWETQFGSPLRNDDTTLSSSDMLSYLSKYPRINTTKKMGELLIEY